MSSETPSNSLWKVGLGLGAAAFVGYCIYFDRKRRSASDYKEKLREKRQAARARALGPRPKRVGLNMTGPLPNLSDPTDAQAFFLQEVQLGEELLAAGRTMEGVDHLANAVTLCGQPQSLLQILQQTLPQQAFILLMERLPAAEDRLAELSSSGGAGRPLAGRAGPGPQVEELGDDGGPILEEVPPGERQELIPEELE